MNTAAPSLPQHSAAPAQRPGVGNPAAQSLVLAAALAQLAAIAEGLAADAGDKLDTAERRRLEELTETMHLWARLARLRATFALFCAWLAAGRRLLRRSGRRWFLPAHTVPAVPATSGPSDAACREAMLADFAARPIEETLEGLRRDLSAATPPLGRARRARSPLAAQLDGMLRRIERAVAAQAMAARSLGTRSIGALLIPISRLRRPAASHVVRADEVAPLPGPTVFRD